MLTRIFGYFIIAIFLSFLSETLSYFFLHSELLFVRSRTYSVPHLSHGQFREYIRTRHPVLGWPSSVWLASKSDDWGARVSPANKKLSKIDACVSIYGDSFTFSAEVDNAYAWPNLIAENLGCRVLNYGVGGYGVGQAVKRLEINKIDDAPITILGIYMDDLNRSMNQWRYLISGTDPLTFKPRYKIERGQLTFFPLPVNSYQEFLRVAENPRVLANEHFLPGIENQFSQVITDFPFTLSFAKFVLRLLSEIDLGKVSISIPIREWNYPPAYDGPSGPSKEKILLNKRIIERFQNICVKRNKKCVVLIIPDRDALRTFDRKYLWKDIITEFREHVTVWDATAYFSEKIKNRDICYIFDKDGECIQHYNREGYRMLGEFVLKKLLGSLTFNTSHVSIRVEGERGIRSM